MNHRPLGTKLAQLAYISSNAPNSLWIRQQGVGAGHGNRANDCGGGQPAHKVDYAPWHPSTVSSDRPPS